MSTSMLRSLLLASALGALPVTIASAQTAPAPARPAAPQAAPAAPAAPAAKPAAPVKAAPQITFEEIVASEDRRSYQMYAIGAGAIGGVLLFNTVAMPVLGISASGIGTEAAIAASRVYAVTSAVTGGIVANMLYGSYVAR